jgi:ParB-like chromosome segregation protein Spo0J
MRAASSLGITLHQMPVAIVPVESLVITGSPRLSGESANHIRVLAETSAELPPIVVHRSTMRVLDGIHRLRVAILRGQRHIKVRLFDGDEASAFVLAVETNIVHGLPLSLNDRKAAATRIIELYPDWSDRRIGVATGLAHGTVAAIRARATGQAGQLHGRVGRDGRMRPRDVAERRARAAQLLMEHPGASLREIAKRAGLSPTSVRTLRTRLLQGPLPVQGDRTSERFEQTAEQRRAVTSQRSMAPETSAMEEDAALRALRADPAFRSTENGRILLQILSTYRIIEEQGMLLIENSPPHCIDRLVIAGRACARVWQEFAEQIGDQRKTLSQ